MADPVTLTLGAGAVLGALSSINQGNTQASNLQQQAAAQQYNAELYQQQAQQTMMQASVQANQQQRNARQVLGMQRAQTAESGTGFEGTSGMLIGQSAANAELDRQNILYSGMLNAQSLNSQADQSIYAANVANDQVGQSQAAGYVGAASSLLSGFGQYSMLQNKATKTNPTAGNSFFGF